MFHTSVESLHQMSMMHSDEHPDSVFVLRVCVMDHVSEERKSVSNFRILDMLKIFGGCNVQLSHSEALPHLNEDFCHKASLT